MFIVLLHMTGTVNSFAKLCNSLIISEEITLRSKITVYYVFNVVW